MLDYKQLQEGKGKGKRVHWMEMIKRETTSNRNLTWFMKDIDINARIKDIIYDEILERLRFVLVTPEKGTSLYNIRTSMDKDMEKIINNKKEKSIPGVPAK